MFLTTVGANPNWYWSPPISFSTNRPIFDVGKPFTHALFTGPRRSPFYFGIILQNLFFDRGHSDEPTVHCVVQQRVIGSPTMWVIVSICVLSIERILLCEKVDNIGITILDISSVKLHMSSFNKSSIHSNSMLCWKTFLHSKIVIVFTIHHRCMHNTCSVSSSDEISTYDSPSSGMIRSIDCTFKQRLVGLTN